MHNDLLDESLLGRTAPDWDSKTITRINDAKIELNAHLKSVATGYRRKNWSVFSLS